MFLHNLPNGGGFGVEVLDGEVHLDNNATKDLITENVDLSVRGWEPEPIGFFCLAPCSCV